MVTICHISDTHLREFNPEPADILVHSGDGLNYGHLEDLMKFRDNLAQASKKYKHVIFVPGNHDRIFEYDFNIAITLLQEVTPNLHVLHNQAIELEGIKFYGTADQPYFCNWAFNVKDNLDLYERYLGIPEDTEVLITHCPAQGILDRTVDGQKVGSRALTLALPRLKKLKAHLFGHIHNAYGVDYINDIWYSNASICGEDYLPINEPRMIEIEN